MPGRGHSTSSLGTKPASIRTNANATKETAALPLTQLSQLDEESEQYQRTHSESLHYTALAGRRAIFSGANTWWRLWREIEVEVAGQKLLVGGEFGVTAEDQGAAVGGREMHIEHLDSCELVEHSSRWDAGRPR